MTLRTAALYGRDPRDLRTSARDARAARRAPGRRDRGGCAELGPRQGTLRSSGTAAIVAHLGSQRLPAAHLRRLHVPVGRQRRHRDARQGQGGVRRPDRRRDLGDDLGAPPHLHDHDGLGLRDARAPARPQNAPLLRRRGRQRPGGDQDRRSANATAVTTNGRSLRGAALFLSVAIPIGFVGYAQHIRHTVGFNWLGALGALVALSLVIATAVIASRK